MAHQQSSKTRAARRAASSLSALTLVLAFGLAQAAESLFITGAEYSEDNQYAFIGTIVPFKGSSLGNGWVQRYWLEWLRYKFSHNGEVEARSPGVEAALGYQKAYTSGYWSAYAGIYYRDVEHSPETEEPRVRGSMTRLRMGLGAEEELGRLWRVDGIASYVFVQEAFWMRGRLLRSIRGPLSAGAEAIFQGDPDYQGTKLGAVITGFEPFRRASLELKAGVGKIEQRASKPYVGVELGLLF
jgi:hypothetical protein